MIAIQGSRAGAGEGDGDRESNYETMRSGTTVRHAVVSTGFRQSRES